MDTTKWYEDPVYIKMCEKAEKIQEVWWPCAGDWVKYRDNILFDIGLYLGRMRESKFIWMEYFLVGANGADQIIKMGAFHKANLIWLPLQHQLQEMAKLGLLELLAVLAQFWVTCPRLGYTLPGPYENPKAVRLGSMEQLWLAFEMKEKYGKIWNGTEWHEATQDGT